MLPYFRSNHLIETFNANETTNWKQLQLWWCKTDKGIESINIQFFQWFPLGFEIQYTVSLISHEATISPLSHPILIQTKLSAVKLISGFNFVIKKQRLYAYSWKSLISIHFWTRNWCNQKRRKYNWLFVATHWKNYVWINGTFYFYFKQELHYNNLLLAFSLACDIWQSFQEWQQLCDMFAFSAVIYKFITYKMIKQYVQTLVITNIGFNAHLSISSINKK